MNLSKLQNRYKNFTAAQTLSHVFFICNNQYHIKGKLQSYTKHLSPLN